MTTAVLIVEDEYSIANLIKQRLEDEDFNVRVAYTYGDGIKKIKDKNPDVITLDIVLPDGNGLELLKNLKSDPDTNKIPVIIISSSNEQENANKLGAKAFVDKPIKFDKLMKILKEVHNASCHS